MNNNSTPNVKDHVTEQEWQMRVNLAACYRLIASYGWDDLVFTHISARVPDTEDEFSISILPDLPFIAPSMKPVATPTA